ncbi:MAG TPA: hypothetical protein VHI74_02310 [Methyloceanibacter sp.]|jgi:hypothetical protein|nr:hypothetical protein [Methyloceanibacter sp.]
MAFWRFKFRIRTAGTAALLLAATLTGLICGPARAADSLYTVAKISVDVTAKDAVAAREMGMAEAEQRAVMTVLKRIVPTSAYSSLPEISKDDIETLVNGVSIRSEQNSTTRYLAVLDISLNEQALQQFLQDQNISFSEARAPSISILPLMLDGGSVKSEGAEGWREAWEDLDLSHSVTPATILRPRPDLDAGTVKAVLAGDPPALASMQEDYNYGQLFIAVGELDHGQFVTRLAGTDAVGPITFEQSDKLTGDAKTAARNAAGIAFGVLENRWKMSQEGEAPASEVKHEEGSGTGAETEGKSNEPAEVPRNVVAEVEFSGLKDWQDIRGRLMNIAGIQGLEVNSLSARAASITFDYAGSLGKLQTELGQNGFELGEKDGNFVLRSR